MKSLGEGRLQRQAKRVQSLVYARAGRCATHGRDLYLRTCPDEEGGNLDNRMFIVEPDLALDNAATQRKPGKIYPAVLFLFSDEGEFADWDLAIACE